MSEINGIFDLRPGDLMFGPIHGLTGVAVGLGQLALGEGFSLGKLRIRHVGIITEALHMEPPSEEWPTGAINVGKMVQAMPSGAEEVNIRQEMWSPEYAYCRIPEDFPGQSMTAAAYADDMIGIPYSFASYAALAAWRFGLSTPKLETWIGRRDERGLPIEAICSVLADDAWSLAGKKIMIGVPHQCVTPGALAGRLLTMPGTIWGGAGWS